MRFKEQDLVRVTTTPSEAQTPQQELLLNRVGFIEYIEVRKPRGPGMNQSGPGCRYKYHVGILSEEGLDRVVTISEIYLTLDGSEEAKNLYDNYQTTLDEIQQEANDRQHQKMAVTNYLARRHNVSPDEIHGIYKAMLHYQDYYKNLPNQSSQRTTPRI